MSMSRLPSFGGCVSIWFQRLVILVAGLGTVPFVLIGIKSTPRVSSPTWNSGVSAGGCYGLRGNAERGYWSHGYIRPRQLHLLLVGEQSGGGLMDGGGRSEG